VKKIAATGLVVMTLGLIAILGAFVPTAAAQVATQGAGKARTLTLTVDNIAINSGARLIVTARSNGACQFLLEWNGIRRIQRAGEKFRTTFVAPDVTSLTKIVVHGTCFYTAPRPPQLKSRPGSPRRVGNTDAQTFEVFVPPSLQRSVTVTVLPAGTDQSSWRRWRRHRLAEHWWPQPVVSDGGTDCHDPGRAHCQVRTAAPANCRDRRSAVGDPVLARVVISRLAGISGSATFASSSNHSACPWRTRHRPVRAERP
jgi:hypothetical protein